MDDPLLGQQLGSYQLVQTLGRGSFAQVYLGKHVHLYNHVAVKVLHAQLGPLEEKDFRQEAVLLQNLRNEHIVRMLDYGIITSRPFIVMELAMKGALSKIYPHGTRLPLPQVVEYTLQIADGLGCAHEQKIVHRDIKPENILVNEKGDLLLGDFGIARLSSTSRASLTSTLAGTLAYMAPEQIMGQSNFASDQYALAIIVYEWLTGRFPFQGSAPEMIAQHLHNEPPPLRQYNPQLAPEIEQVVLTALRKEPTRRFSKVQAFANALKQAVQLDSVELDTARAILREHAAVPHDPVVSDAQSVAQRYLPARPKRTAPPVTSLPMLPQAVATEFWWPTYFVPVEERRAISQGSMSAQQLEMVGPLANSLSQPVPLPVSHVASVPNQGSLRDITPFSLVRPAVNKGNTAPRLATINRPVMRSTGNTGNQPRVNVSNQPRGNTGAQPRVGGGARQVRSTAPIGTQSAQSGRSYGNPSPESGATAFWATMSSIALFLAVVCTLAISGNLSAAGGLLGWSFVLAVTSIVSSFVVIGSVKGKGLRQWTIFCLIVAVLLCLINLIVLGNVNH